MSNEAPKTRSRRPRKVLTIGTGPEGATDQPIEVAAAQTDSLIEDAASAAQAVKPTNRYLQLGFLTAVLVGIFFAVLGSFEITPVWVGLAGPLLSIIGFYVFGKVQQFDAYTDTRQQFADSCYFLGFLLTMVAMLVGFLPAGLFDQEITSQGILRHFSMALGATALGLVFRIVVLQGGRSLDQLSAEIETDLLRYARGVSDEAKEIGAELRTAREELADHRRALKTLVTQDLRTVTEEAFAPLGTAGAKIADLLEKQSSSLAGSAERIQRALGEAASQVHEAQALRAQADEEVAQTITSIRSSLAAFDASIASLRESLTTIGNEAGVQIRAVADALQTGTTAAPRIAAAAQSLEASLQDAEASFSALKANGDQLSSRFEAELGESGRLLGELATAQESTTKAIGDAGETATKVIQTETARLSAALVDERQSLSRDLEQHRSASQQQTTDLAAAFRSDLEAATGRLSAILSNFADQIQRAQSLSR